MAKINMGVWTQAERSQFEKGVVQFGWGNWLVITKGIPSRRKSQVKSHAQKFALHRPVEYAKLIDKHNKMEAIKKKKKVDGGTVSPKATSTQLRKKAAVKKVMRASKRLVRTAAAKGMSKPALLKVENPSKGTPRKNVVAKEEPKLGAQPTSSKDDLFMEIGSGPMKVDSPPTTDDDDTSGLERPSSTKKDEGESKLRAQLSQMHIKVEDSPTADKSEMRCGGISPLPTVTPTSSIKASADEAETLKFLFSNLDDLEGWENSHKDAPDDVEVKSFLDMNPEEQCDIFPGIIEDSSFDVACQDNWCHALAQLRLQVQPNDAALYEVAAYLESPPDSPKHESKSALMRRRFIKLAMDASDVGWWRESEMMMPDIAKKAHLEHLVAMTFAVLQADAWKSSSEDSSFNAQDDIRHICQLIPGIWNRVNYSLARDSFELFETGTGHLDRSHAVNKMVRMFDKLVG